MKYFLCLVAVVVVVTACNDGGQTTAKQANWSWKSEEAAGEAARIIEDYYVINGSYPEPADKSVGGSIERALRRRGFGEAVHVEWQITEGFNDSDPRRVVIMLDGVEYGFELTSLRPHETWKPVWILDPVSGESYLLDSFVNVSNAIAYFCWQTFEALETCPQRFDQLEPRDRAVRLLDAKHYEATTWSCDRTESGIVVTVEDLNTGASRTYDLNSDTASNDCYVPRVEKRSATKLR